MPNIAIVVAAPVIPAGALMELHRVTGRGMSDIRRAISQRIPIYEQEIFDAKYEERASTIRAIVECLKTASVPICVYELPEGESMESCSIVEECRISVEVLDNILNEADAELVRQRNE